MKTRRSTRSMEALVEELISLPPHASAGRIENDPKLCSLEVASQLTECSADALPERPDDSERFAVTALRILNLLSSDARAVSMAARASCHMGDACRLRGDFGRAADALDSAAGLDMTKEESAIHLRSFAVLRWEQGRCDEAVGLLIRAERLFRDSGLVPEASATTQLLILFYAEIGESPEAIALFRHLGPADPTLRPWLSARTALTAAFLLAHRSDLARPEEALAALALGASLIPYVREAEELLQLEWFQARALARMGHFDEAESTLLALRQRLSSTLTSADLNFHLLTLDLLALRRAAGRETHDLLQDLEILPPSVPYLQPTASVMRFWLNLDESSSPWEFTSSIGFHLKRAFRLNRLPLALLPFA